MKMLSRAWWHTPLIPALGRQRQEDFWVQGQPGLQSEFQDSQGYTEKPCLEKQKKKKKRVNRRHCPAPICSSVGSTKGICVFSGCIPHPNTHNGVTYKHSVHIFCFVIISTLQESQKYYTKSSCTFFTQIHQILQIWPTYMLWFE
jgi:hypothetical protein